MLRNNYVMSPKSKWLVFTTTIGDKGLNRMEIKKLIKGRMGSIKVIQGHLKSVENSKIKRFKRLK